MSLFGHFKFAFVFITAEHHGGALRLLANVPFFGLFTVMTNIFKF
jgi:hypothetical protein|nr:MAG TPA: hypothetical protein [Caudoviricetes sp.]